MQNSVQALQDGITWKECVRLPIKLSRGKTTVIDGKVYCGGGFADNDKDDYNVYCYDQSQDKWTILPSLRVTCFGLGQVNSKLVAVGGKESDVYANVVYTYDQQSQEWEQEIPPMPTARQSPGVLSLQSALVVAGGYTLSSHTSAVEIFKPDTSQWYRSDPLPNVCRDISLIAIGNTCYALGGYMYNDTHLNNMLYYASIDVFLCNAVPADQTNHTQGSSVSQSAWKVLPNTPTYGPVAAMLAGNLLAMGGCEIPEGGDEKKVVYMYSPSTNSWIYISDLPTPLSDPGIAMLSSTEILVIGGWSGGYRGARVNTVYKGLHL